MCSFNYYTLILFICSTTVCFYTVEAASSFPWSLIENESLSDFDGSFFHNASLHRVKRQRAPCPTGQWRCRNGIGCIDSENVCDGTVDCQDKSDETLAQCRKMRCASYLFRCTYGACIDAGGKCNGVNDCADGSDELHKDCVKTTTAVKTCPKTQFQCNNGQCVDREGTCDGKVDCEDRSDESVEHCSGRKCPSYLFKCAYGACIDGGSNCNNVVECADASDENELLCKDVPGYVPPVLVVPTIPPTTKPVISTQGPPDAQGGCPLPEYPDSGKYKVENYNKKIAFGDLVAPYTPLIYSCKKNYDVFPFNVALCQDDSTWTLSPICLRQCPMVTSYTVDFTCYAQNGTLIACPDMLSSGSTITSKCKASHFSTILPKLTCIEGNFDNPIPKCTVECGVEKSTGGGGYVIGGELAKRGTFPWHVGIYQFFENRDPNFEQICGGTLVATHVIISAAHCFYDANNNPPVIEDNYRIKAGKHYRDWDHTGDNNIPYIQTTEVSKIYLPESYGGDEQQHQSDLAIIHVKIPFKFSDSVHPACIDLVKEEFNRQQTSPGNVGKVAGWGLVSEGGPPSEELKTLTVPVIDYNVCKEEMKKYNFKRYLTPEKLCAGYLNGSALCKGDSGGGLVFPNVDSTDGMERWYLRGIVSVGPTNDARTSCRSNSYTAFTQIYKLRDFISETFMKVKIT